MYSLKHCDLCTSFTTPGSFLQYKHAVSSTFAFNLFFASCKIRNSLEENLNIHEDFDFFLNFFVLFFYKISVVKVITSHLVILLRLD